MAKNIVVLSDGTGQSYNKTPSNVLRLYELLLNDSRRQVALYNPGIATSPQPIGLNPRRRVSQWLGLGWGFGLTEDVTTLYKFLTAQYLEGDRIFLFGFSRGAFTVRALAALIHVCGLLRPDDLHLVPDALELFATAESRIREDKKAGHIDLREFDSEPIDHAKFDQKSREFRSTCARECRIDFMGLWDTVKAYGFFWPRSFPCLRHNPSVFRVRHAVALNERRSHFQMTGWGDRDDQTERVKEAWFMGDHSDVGGGHDEGNNRLADITLLWMLGEATNHGLLLDESKREQFEKLMKINSESLPPPGNLDKGFQWWLSRCPRPELNNTHYPPSRPFKFKPSAERQPLDHKEKSLLRYHTTTSQGDEETLDVKWPELESREFKRPV